MSTIQRYALLVALFGLGCSSGGVGAADVVLTPSQLMQELIADRGGTLDKYDGKRLELSGTVGSKIEPQGLNDTRGVIFSETSEKTRFDANLSFFGFDPANAEEFDAIAVGQKVVLVCRFSVLDQERSVFLVKECRVRP